MSATVTLPIWVVVMAGLLAAIAILDRLLIPSLRWALRVRANRAVVWRGPMLGKAIRR